MKVPNGSMTIRGNPKLAGKIRSFDQQKMEKDVYFLKNFYF